MKVQFQVIRDGDTIFEKRFLAPVDGRYGDISAMAVTEFQIAHPGVLLVDEDVILKWADVGD